MLTAKPLPLKLDGADLHWGGFAAPARDLRVVFMGANPFGSGNTLVIATGSLQSLGGLDTPSTSFAIYRNGAVLRQGSYDEKFQEVDPERLSEADARADIEQFFSTLERVHPNLLSKVTPAEYQAMRAKIGVPARRRDLESALLYAAALFRDGHTSVQGPERANPQNTAGVRFPPFLLGFDNGAFTIDGEELMAIDGVPILQFLAPILERCSGETLGFRASRFTGGQAAWYRLTELFHADSFQATLAGGRSQTFRTVPFAEFAKLQPRKQARLTHVEFLRDGAVAHFVYPSFTKSTEEEKKIDEIFRSLQERHTSDLIIDLRGNGGGNSNMGDYIFSYLYGRRFRAFSEVDIKLSPDILARDGPRLGESKNARAGQVVAQHGAETLHPRRAAFFTGKVWLMVDNGTFSSATDFTAMIRDYQVATIVGYETGGLPTCYGDLFSFTLKHSEITCFVSHKLFKSPKPRPGDDRHGVLPDVPFNRTLLTPHRDQADPALAYTLTLIRGK